MKHSLAFAIHAFLSLSSATELNFYEGEHCIGDVLVTHNVDISVDECTPISLPQGGPYSVELSDSWNSERDSYREPKSTSKTVRIYDSNDCTSSCSNRTVIGELSERYECTSFKTTSANAMAFFRIVEVGQSGVVKQEHDRFLCRNNYGTLSDEVCLLHHGMQIYVRSQHSKMQQVAANLFREIAVESWDDKLHTRNTSRRFAEHGDVDATGKLKYRRKGPGFLEEIPLHQWNETKHIEIWNKWDVEAERYERNLNNICENVPEDKIGEDGFVTFSNNIRLACGDAMGRKSGQELDYMVPDEIVIDGAYEFGL